jgi:hypothetical protein
MHWSMQPVIPENKITHHKFLIGVFCHSVGQELITDICSWEIGETCKLNSIAIGLVYQQIAMAQ